MQKTYLSRAFHKEDVHFSSDQLFLACEFLRLGDDEREFLDLLHRYARTSVPKLKKQFEIKIREIQQNLLKTETYLAVDQTPEPELESFMSEYYLDLNLQLVHIFLTIDRFAHTPELIRKELGLEHEQFSELLRKLVNAGLIAEETSPKGQRFRVLKSSMHLKADSPYNPPYQALMRLHSTARARMTPPGQNYSYSVFFSADPDTRHAIQKNFMEWLESIRKKVQKSEPTGVYQLCFDMTPWSREA
jgi:hypothetical protein